jgi:hypothetical protein
MHWQWNQNGFTLEKYLMARDCGRVLSIPRPQAFMVLAKAQNLKLRRNRSSTAGRDPVPAERARGCRTNRLRHGLARA